MKKYRKLEAGERVKNGDEFLHASDGSGEWKDMSHEDGYIVTNHDEGYVRRPVPSTGKVAFLVTVSATTRVVLNCDGLSDEEIDERLAEMACQKISANPSGYIHAENIDWENTKEDTECPAVEDEKITEPQYRPFKFGETIGEGDQVYHKGEWFDFDKSVYGDSIDAGFVEDNEARKLIK